MYFTGVLFPQKNYFSDWFHENFLSFSPLSNRVSTDRTQSVDNFTMDSLYLKRTFSESFRLATSRSSAPLGGATHDQSLPCRSLLFQQIIIFHVQPSRFMFDLLRKIVAVITWELSIGISKDEILLWTIPYRFNSWSFCKIGVILKLFIKETLVELSRKTC